MNAAASRYSDAQRIGGSVDGATENQAPGPTPQQLIVLLMPYVSYLQYTRKNLRISKS